ncbi:MAG: hypothetical protein E6G08_20300 [Actinobacteria bacterium]|nr:MAG: hypothetical protein E6G08_20300 [Actinomycetota bacterium]
MAVTTTKVASVEELQRAVADDRAGDVVVAGAIERVPTLRLAPGRNLVGADDRAALVFRDGADGVQLTRDNRVASLRLRASPSARVVFNDTTVESLGTLELVLLHAVGQVQILADDAVVSGHVILEGVHVEEADTRVREPRPHGYGVHVLQGAITVWNQQIDPAARITADLTGLSAGSEETPVRGSGVFVSGGGDRGGRLEATRLHTGPVFADGGIPGGTAGGIFVVYGAHVQDVDDIGPVTTYGVGDVVLGNWGVVDSWKATAPLTSYGASGTGFVNHGMIGRLEITAPVETSGPGAHGFDVDGGTVDDAELYRIVTHADAAVGMQIGRPFGRLIVHHGIETHGVGAVGLSLRPEADGSEISVDGGIVAHADGVPPLEIHGRVDELTVTGGVA